MRGREYSCTDLRANNELSRNSFLIGKGDALQPPSVPGSGLAVDDDISSSQHCAALATQPCRAECWLTWSHLYRQYRSSACDDQ